MSRKTSIYLVIFAILAVGICALAGVTAYFADLPQRLSQHETIVLGQSQLVPGSQAALRVVVRDARDASPLPDADILVSLASAQSGVTRSVFTGKTGADGTAVISFKVPEGEDENQVLKIETRSSLGSDMVERPVTLKRDYRVLLTTDKPLYQPGQVIHVRGLALSAFDLTPAASQEMEIVIADGKGNKVFRKKLTTSSFGVASTDFQLASEVNTGAYKITAALGNTSSEKTVTVEHYVLPKFSVDLTTEKPFYLPGEHVSGSIDAAYFFGKTVGSGKVSIDGYTFDVQRNPVFHLEGQTDEAGHFNFEFDLPAYIAGSDLEGGLGRFYLEVHVTDLAQHSETSSLSFPVAQHSLVIEAMPEGGQFRPGVENILYVLTSYPDGTPAPSRLSLQFYTDGQNIIEVETGPYGLAEIRLTPQSPYQQFRVDARDERGNTASQEFYYEGEWSQESILLRPEQPVYRVGDTMNLTILTSQPQGAAYLDIVREGQTLSTRSVDVQNGLAQIAVDLTPDLFGTLELHAYKILSDGNITRDTRLVVVDRAEGLSIAIHPDRESYLPGNQAGLDLQVNGSDGSGVHSAVGLAIVDESVFALAEQDPGFARLYFLLEQELLTPKYDLHGFSVPELVSGLPQSDPSAQAAIQGAAQASLAAAAPRGMAFSLQANSHQEAVQRARDLRIHYFANLSKGLYVLLLAIPLFMLGLSAYAAWRDKRLGLSLSLTFLLLAILALVFLAIPVTSYSWMEPAWLARLAGMLELFQFNSGAWLAGLALAGIAAYLSFLVYAIARKDASLGWSLLLALAFLGAIAGLGYAMWNGEVYPKESLVLWGLGAFALMPLAFLLRFSNDAMGKRILPAVASLVLALCLLVGTVPGLAMGSMGAAMAPRQVEMMDANILGFAEQAAMMEVPVAAMMPTPTESPAAMQETKGSSDGNRVGNASEPPRLRQYFPETMLWLADAETDANGALHLDFPVADSITTWRVTALASSQDGRLGSTAGSLRVFQDFFIDLDLPRFLTVGDEVSIPVGVFNYMPQEQTVRLEVEPAAWFDLLDEPAKEITIPSNDIQVVYFRIRAAQFGSQPFKVTAWGSSLSDAIQKQVRVFPNGKLLTFSKADRLTSGTPVIEPVDIPADAIPGTQALLVKIYPGVVSQVVEGLDGILRMPNGCFEQTSSTTYPNVLVLDYLKTTDQTAPEVQLKAEEYINLGYQRLTTFEVESSGGFSLFGDAPADRMLTAYGLQEFSDMARVSEVDADLIRRAAEWLLSQQAADGSWENDRGLVHENTWSSLGDDRLPVTAYITWSLIAAGYGDDPRTQNGVSYLRERQAGAQDAYVLALVSNALVAADLQAGNGLDGSTKAVLDRLAGMVVQEGNTATWSSGVATFMGSEGKTGSIETTALAALAFLRSGEHPDLANAALTYLIQQKDNFGTWYSTQATVLTLKALIESLRLAPRM